MSVLLLDCGNSRLKWALQPSPGAAFTASGSLGHDELAQLQELRRYPAPVFARAVHVAGEPLWQAMTGALKGWATPQRVWPVAAACGVVNGYRDPAQLGADRWAAVVAAWQRTRGACLVVCAGTATTIDALDETGRFPGGLILPGLDLMRSALSNGTARLPLGQGRQVAFPAATDDAIISGCLAAQAGAIAHQLRHLPAGVPCWLTGGAAPLIAPLLDAPCQQVEHLVLEGLGHLAWRDRPEETECA